LVLKIFFNREEIEDMIEEVIDQFNEPDQKSSYFIGPHKS
jgi:hypothetical protein